MHFTGLACPLLTNWFLTDQKAKGFPGSPRGRFRKGHYRNSKGQGRGREKQSACLEVEQSGEWESRTVR